MSTEPLGRGSFKGGEAGAPPVSGRAGGDGEAEGSRRRVSIATSLLQVTPEVGEMEHSAHRRPSLDSGPGSAR